MIHLRFEGKSYDISPLDLRLDAGMGDEQIKERVAQYLDVGLDRVAPYVVDRSPTGHVILRPEAVYG